MTDLIPSRVESANTRAADFPLNNLPCGVFSRNGGKPHCGTAIGDRVLDLHALEERGPSSVMLGPGRPAAEAVTVAGLPPILR